CICIILSQLSEISIAYLIKTAKNCIFMVTLYKDGKLHMILMKAISKSFKSGIPLHDSCHGIPLEFMPVSALRHLHGGAPRQYCAHTASSAGSVPLPAPRSTICAGASASSSHRPSVSRAMDNPQGIQSR